MSVQMHGNSFTSESNMPEKKKAAEASEASLNLNRNDIRLRVLYMYQLLLKYTDAEHQLTTNQIRDILEKEHGITMPGRAI